MHPSRRGPRIECMSSCCLQTLLRLFKRVLMGLIVPIGAVAYGPGARQKLDIYRPTGHSPSELAGWVGLAGPYDFLPITNPDARPVFNHPDYPAASQPLEHVHPGAPAAFLGAAKKDDLVNPQRNTVALARRLQAAGAKVTLHLYDRVDHVTLAAAFSRPLRWLAPVLDDVAAFVTRETLALK